LDFLIEYLNKKDKVKLDIEKKNLQEIERVIKMNTRLKNESGIASEQLWKRTQQGLLKLEAKLLGLATRIREIRGQ
jgi:GTP-binding protein EngB required for normal cell division